MNVDWNISRVMISTEPRVVYQVMNIFEDLTTPDQQKQGKL